MTASSPIKLRPFDPAFLHVWFAQLDVVFEQEELTTEAQRFSRAFIALDPRHADLCADIQPTDRDCFTQLKKRLTTVYAPQDGSKLIALLQDPPSDELPTALARRLQRALPSSTPEILTRQLFLRILPEHIRLHIAANPSKSVTSLATLADDLLAILPSPRLATVDEETAVVQNKPNTKTQRQKKLCYFHRRWGINARRCRKPCSWTKRSSGNDEARPQ